MKLQTGNGLTLTGSYPLFNEMTENVLKEIADLLIEKGKITSDLGIPLGRAGISLFLFQYYKFTQNENYYNAAYDLLDQIHEYISDPAIPTQELIKPEIGWLFMHLHDLDLIDIDMDEVLEGIDAALYNRCVYGTFKQLNDGYLLNIGAYFVLRYGNTKLNPNIIKIEDALINIVDEVRLLYPYEVKQKLLEIYEHEDTCSRIAVNKLIRAACNIGILLSRINALDIYKQIINNTLSEIYEDLRTFVLKNPQFHKGILNDDAAYATLIYTIFTITCLNQHIENSDDDYWELIKSTGRSVISSDEQTPYIADLLVTISCLQSLNDFNEGLATDEIEILMPKLLRSIHRTAPGYLGALSGIPNLGLKGGIAGAGMAILSALQGKPLINGDIMLITSK